MKFYDPFKVAERKDSAVLEFCICLCIIAVTVGFLFLIVLNLLLSIKIILALVVSRVLYAVIKGD